MQKFIDRQLEQIYPHTCQDKIKEVEKKLQCTTNCLCPPEIQKKRRKLKQALKDAYIKGAEGMIKAIRWELPHSYTSREFTLYSEIESKAQEYIKKLKGKK